MAGRAARIPDGNNLFRHAIHPVSFRKTTFVTDKFWHLSNEPDGTILGSLAWERYAPTAHYVHAHGCRLASRRNEAKRLSERYDDKKRQVYCGAYQVTARSVRDIALDELAGVLSADVVHHVEEGEIAHTDLRFTLVKPEAFDVEGTKTAIIDRLWNACTGPLAHACDCDRALNPHPNTLLAIPPLGRYRDQRWWITRIWCFIRFKCVSYRERKRSAQQH